jgi:hypothetical protein
MWGGCNVCLYSTTTAGPTPPGTFSRCSLHALSATAAAQPPSCATSGCELPALCRCVCCGVPAVCKAWPSFQCKSAGIGAMLTRASHISLTLSGCERQPMAVWHGLVCNYKATSVSKGSSFVLPAVKGSDPLFLNGSCNAVQSCNAC